MKKLFKNIAKTAKTATTETAEMPEPASEKKAA